MHPFRLLSFFSEKSPVSSPPHLLACDGSNERPRNCASMPHRAPWRTATLVAIASFLSASNRVLHVPPPLHSTVVARVGPAALSVIDCTACVEQLAKRWCIKTLWVMVITGAGGEVPKMADWCSSLLRCCSNKKNFFCSCLQSESADCSKHTSV